MTKAWMLRQDGAAFPVVQHLYAMNDDNLSSEAEVASFLISSGSGDIDLCEYVLDSWMAMLIENKVRYDEDEEGIRRTIRSCLNSLPYRFPYPLKPEKYIEIHDRLDNYNDIDTLYDYVDDVRSNLNKIQTDIQRSLNQQFCRVRFGGKYNSVYGDSTIWFRISSVGYNWANTIYKFAADNLRKLKIDSITICRDYESDNGDVEGKPEYFYKAKDGTVYYDMPIDEYLEEEHEHSQVFSNVELNAGVLATVRSRLSNGNTFRAICSALNTSGIPSDPMMWGRLVNQELKANYVDASEYLENAPTRTQNRLMGVMKKILRTYPEISAIDVDVKPHDNGRGKETAKEYIFSLSSKYEKIDGLQVSSVFYKDHDQTEKVYQGFCTEYDEYIENMGIRL